MRSLRSLRSTLTVVTAAAGAFLVCGTVHAQQQRTFHLTVSPTGYAHYQASHAHNFGMHLMRANTPAGRAARSLNRLALDRDGASQSSFGSKSAPALSSGTRYPGDLQDHGGEHVQSATQYLIYVNMRSNGYCNSIATCWGNPGRFLSDLGQSNFIHIVDQYVDASDGGRYRVSGDKIFVRFPPKEFYSDLNIQTIVYAVVSKLGLPGGFHAIYDVFLPPGQDECAGVGVCYSPNMPSKFFYCAYHAITDLPGIGPTLYTVEPFQDVGGCSVGTDTPNGQLIDSTNNVLSHETFETITDPNVGGAWPTGWWNELNNGMFGEEIGDECSFIVFDPPPPAVPFSGPPGTVYFDPSEVSLNGHEYAIQPEYSNAQHGCATSSPPGP